MWKNKKKENNEKKEGEKERVKHKTGNVYCVVTE